MKRVIFVEPQMDNGSDIFEFFKKNNSDSRMVGMHICLVFPFDSDLTTDDMQTIMEESLSGQKKFQITVKGTSVSFEAINNFLFLDVDDSKRNLFNMSKELYQRLEGYAQLFGNYNPHITVGKCPDMDGFEKMQNELEILGPIEFKATVDTVYCKVMDMNENGEPYLKDEVVYHLQKKIDYREEEIPDCACIYG